MPVNTKSMFSMLCIYMEKLDNKEIDTNQAIAMTKLVQQAGNLLNYELRRAMLMTNDSFKLEHRNLEIKNFEQIS